jgi:hypothetical protein
LAAGRGPAAPPVAVDYTISGAVKVTNDCDGQIASIPDRVTVETELQNQPANIAVPGRTTINLAPDPAAGPNPIKIGTYSITVRWLPGTTVAPARWLAPKVVDAPNGTRICAVIRCPVDGPCRDLVPVADVAFADPTTHDIVVVCACT